MRVIMIIAIIIIMAKIGSLLMVKVGLHYPSSYRVKFEYFYAFFKGNNCDF